MVPSFFDSILIAPFRLFADPLVGFCFGCAVLALGCVLLGRLTVAGLVRAGRGHYDRLASEVRDSHELSMKALRAGDKAAYLAVNGMAHERFGKHFFAGAALGTSSLWPVPFALGWLAGRFEGIELFRLPLLARPAGYPFVFIGLYIVIRVAHGRLERAAVNRRAR